MVDFLIDIAGSVYVALFGSQERASFIGMEFGETIYMDAVLEPNRSLSPGAFKMVMAIVATASIGAGFIYLLLGAWPVVGFFGLDALIIWLLFRRSFRDQRQRTRVRVTAEHVRLHHIRPDGTEKEAELPTAFARVELNEPLSWNSWLRIEHGQKAYVIGRFLTPKERKSLAEALRTALIRARSERLPA